MIGLFKTRGAPNFVADSVNLMHGFRNIGLRRLSALGRQIHAVVFENRVLPGGAEVPLFGIPVGLDAGAPLHIGGGLARIAIAGICPIGSVAALLIRGCHIPGVPKPVAP